MSPCHGAQSSSVLDKLIGNVGTREVVVTVANDRLASYNVCNLKERLVVSLRWKTGQWATGLGWTTRRILT